MRSGIRRSDQPVTPLKLYENRFFKSENTVSWCDRKHRQHQGYPIFVDQTSSLVLSAVFRVSFLPFLFLLVFTNLLKETLVYYYAFVGQGKLKNEKATGGRREKKIERTKCIIILSLAKLQRAFLHLIVKYVHSLWLSFFKADGMRKKPHNRALFIRIDGRCSFHLIRIAFHVSCSTTPHHHGQWMHLASLIVVRLHSICLNSDFDTCALCLSLVDVCILSWSRCSALTAIAQCSADRRYVRNNIEYYLYARAAIEQRNTNETQWTRAQRVMISSYFVSFSKRPTV